MRGISFALGLVAVAFACYAAGARELTQWKREFPRTDFTRSSIDLGDIRFDGPRRDTIPPIHAPKFRPVSEETELGRLEPVIGLTIRGDARAYPLRILLWHEIVNDTVGGIPVLVSYCPLCNSGVVFDRRVAGETLTFGNTGRIRHFDMVMYDHRTESWWQQFTGTAIVGLLDGKRMTPIPSRLESLAAFRKRAPAGRVLRPDDPSARPYGTTPFAGMDTRSPPPGAFPYPLPNGVQPFDYVIVIENRAWPLARLIAAGHIVENGLRLSWTAGRNSIHDTEKISRGRDLGNVVVTRQDAPDREVAHDVTFAFAFAAFVPNGAWMQGDR